MCANCSSVTSLIEEPLPKIKSVDELFSGKRGESQMLRISIWVEYPNDSVANPSFRALRDQRK